MFDGAINYISSEKKKILVFVFLNEFVLKTSAFCLNYDASYIPYIFPFLTLFSLAENYSRVRTFLSVCILIIFFSAPILYADGEKDHWPSGCTLKGIWNLSLNGSHMISPAKYSLWKIWNVVSGLEQDNVIDRSAFLCMIYLYLYVNLI